MDEDEPMGTESVGQRLRAAREARGLSIEDIAASTRIPTRHLLSLENSEWDKLPAPTYSVGFAKNYATAVGLDRAEIAEALRGEMGSELPAHYTTAATDTFEPVDSNRSMPKGVVFGALAALVVIALLLSWLSRRELTSDDATPIAATDSTTPATATAPAVTPASQGPVVITASEAAWVEIRDGATVLKQGELGAGQSFEVPASAARPTLTTAKPEALRISVGTGDAPSIGPAGTRVADVSLLAADLMRGPAAPAVAPSTTPAPTAPAPTPVLRRSTASGPVATPAAAPAVVPVVAPVASSSETAAPTTNAI